MTTKDYQKRRPLAIFLGYFRRHKGLFSMDILCATVIALIDLAFPLVTRTALYDLLPNEKYRVFFTTMAVVVAFYLLRSFLNYIVCYYGHTFGIRVEADIREDLFRHMQELSYDFYDQNRTGVLMSRLTSDLFDLTELAHHGPEDLLTSILTICGALIVMGRIQWRLALMVGMMIPIFVIVVFAMRSSMRKASAGVKQKTGHINTEIETSISGFRTAKAFANEEAETERFRDTRLFAFESRNDEAKQMQFAAVSFLLPDGSVFIAYRGTDTSLVGWKENFNMSYLETVPAQARATEYAQEVIRACKHRPYRIGGHSKGGNLAAWAAVHLPEKLQGKRLLAAYNNDGPGFHADLLDTPAYRRVEDRLHTYIPESSIVGVLLVHAEDYDVIDSTSHAAMQHEALSWQVMGNRFVHLGQRSQLGQMSDDVLREWLDSVSQEDREAFCDALYSILSMGGRAKTFEDLRKGGFSGWAALWKEYAGADERKKQILTEVFGRLAIDVKDELMKAAGQGLRSAGHGIRTVGQNLMGRHEPDKTQTK